MALVKYILGGIHCVSAKHGITMTPGFQSRWTVTRKPRGKLLEESHEVDYDAACVAAQMMLEKAGRKETCPKKLLSLSP